MVCRYEVTDCEKSLLSAAGEWGQLANFSVADASATERSGHDYRQQAWRYLPKHIQQLHPPFSVFRVIFAVVQQAGHKDVEGFPQMKLPPSTVDERVGAGLVNERRLFIALLIHRVGLALADVLYPASAVIAREPWGYYVG
jgi:hypothetical protein